MLTGGADILRRVLELKEDHKTAGQRKKSGCHGDHDAGWHGNQLNKSLPKGYKHDQSIATEIIRKIFL